MEQWLQHIINALPDGGLYLGALFLVAFSESLPVIGLLMPGSTLIVMAGFLVFHGKSSLWLLLPVAGAGALVGDLLSFWMGVHFGSKLLRMRSFQKHRLLIRKSEQFFVEHGGKSVFFARFLGPIRGITPFIAGLSGMKSGAFCSYALISAVLWGICYPGLGYLGGHSWQYAQSLAARFGLVLIVGLVAVVIHHWVRKNIRG